MTPQEELAALRSSQKKPLTPIEELRQLRASQDRGSSLGMSRARSFDELLASTSGKDEQMFDYTTGAAGGLRAKISFGETPEEKELILKKIVGDEGYTKDSQGRLALTEAGQISQGMKPVGKNLIIEEEGFSLRDVSDLAGIAPESIGAVIGGIIGAPTLVGGALGAGVGAGLGQSAEESIESLLGIQKQSLGEVAKDVATEAALAGGIDLVTMGRAGFADYG